MTILIDHCVFPRYKRLLESWGYEARLLHEVIQTDAADPDVLETALQLDAILLTFDMDFSNIVTYPPHDYQGIIVIRYQAEDEAESEHTLKSVLKSYYRNNLRRILIVITRDRYRIRQD